jgi:hypothetical protein
LQSAVQMPGLFSINRACWKVCSILVPGSSSGGGGGIRHATGALKGTRDRGTWTKASPWPSPRLTNGSQGFVRAPCLLHSGLWILSQVEQVADSGFYWGLTWIVLITITHREVDSEPGRASGGFRILLATDLNRFNYNYTPG